MAAAEDLVQDLYLKILALDPSAEVKAPTALLYRMASNLLIDQARSAQRSSRRDAEWRMEHRTIKGGQEVVDEPAADETIVAQERIRALAEAVSALPPQAGRAFRLHKLEGLSQAQTAQVMGVSTKMVEQHIHVAMGHLIKRLRS